MGYFKWLINQLKNFNAEEVKTSLWFSWLVISLIFGTAIITFILISIFDNLLIIVGLGIPLCISIFLPYAIYIVKEKLT